MRGRKVGGRGGEWEGGREKGGREERRENEYELYWEPYVCEYKAGAFFIFPEMSCLLALQSY